jgi:hypothetical protein
MKFIIGEQMIRDSRWRWQEIMIDGGLEYRQVTKQEAMAVWSTGDYMIGYVGEILVLNITESKG